MSKDEKKKKKPARTGAVSPEDHELTTWLHRIWHRGNPPERIEVWQAFGRNRLVRGEMVHHEDFKADEKLDAEAANKLADEIMAACQHDCDCSERRRPRFYLIVVIDPHRRASPLTRSIGPLLPKRSYIEGEDDSAEDDDEITFQSAKSIMFGYIRESHEQIRFDKTRADHVTGDLLFLYNNMVDRQQVFIEKLMNNQIAFMDRLNEAEDRRLDRDVIREKEKLKVGFMRDAARGARNLLPVLFGGDEDGAGDKNAAQKRLPGGNAAGGTAIDYGPSTERNLVDAFMSDIDEEEGLSIALFGDFVVEGNKMRQVKPGIFTVQQYYILEGVRRGTLPIEKLDELLPESGHENAVTMDQFNRASDAGVSEGMGTALMRIVTRRRRAVAAKRTAGGSNTNGAAAPAQPSS